MLHRYGNDRRRRLIVRSANSELGGSADAAFAVLDSDAELVPLPDEDGAGTSRAAKRDPDVIPLDPGLPSAEARSELHRLVEGTRPLTWVFTGDGVTQSSGHTEGRRGYVELFDVHVRSRMRRLLDVVINTGVEGSRAATLDRNADWRIDRFRPDVVSIMIGLTDASRGEVTPAQFGDSLTELVVRLRNEGVTVVLNTPHRPDRSRAKRHTRLPQFVAAVRESALEADVLLADHWLHWKRARPDSELLSADGLHPNAAGHRELARVLLATLGIGESR